MDFNSSTSLCETNYRSGHLADLDSVETYHVIYNNVNSTWEGFAINTKYENLTYVNLHLRSTYDVSQIFNFRTL